MIGLVGCSRMSKTLNVKLTMLRPERRENVEARTVAWIYTGLLLVEE